MIESIEYEFGTVDVHKNYVVLTMKEGVLIKPEYYLFLVDIAKKYFDGRKFGYISCRKNSYSVDPLIFFKLSKMKNLVGIALIPEAENALVAIELEKKFFAKPFRVFKKLPEAVQWIESLIDL